MAACLSLRGSSLKLQSRLERFARSIGDSTSMTSSLTRSRVAKAPKPPRGDGRTVKPLWYRVVEGMIGFLWSFLVLKGGLPIVSLAQMAANMDPE